MDIPNLPSLPIVETVTKIQQFSTRGCHGHCPVKEVFQGYFYLPLDQGPWMYHWPSLSRPFLDTVGSPNLKYQ